MNWIENGIESVYLWPLQDRDKQQPQEICSARHWAKGDQLEALRQSHQQTQQQAGVSWCGHLNAGSGLLRDSQWKPQIERTQGD